MYQNSDEPAVSSSMFPAEKTIAEILAKRESKGALRKLFITNKGVDFCSNDYLGFARSPVLFSMVEERMKELKVNNGSGGSRLLAGNSKYAEELEASLANTHAAPSALLFNSGYDANVGLFSSIALRGDTILYDELVHASIHDGIRLSRATSFPFRHNDMTHLEERLHKAKGNVFVVAESIYSMDGDAAPLENIVELCDKFIAHCIVDEAHATGVFGLGKVQEMGLQDKVYARIHTFGKAMGCHGAIVSGSETLKQYLINYARSFIYTTSLPLHSLVSIECAYKLLEKSSEEVKKLHANIKYFKSMNFFRSKIKNENKWIDSQSAIQSLIIPGNEKVKKLALAIQEHNMDVRPIMSPTVAKGKERIRVCLHAYNTIDELDILLNVLGKKLDK
ncbi:MAG TPA: 8-amino-7-oxononanoate synthase [Bacteroidia bacterium]|jgi:8-amino-7-oxononanoate synthase|nr:8-amino-7-oxononanoate synthase [Bacteroidia bacterium]